MFTRSEQLNTNFNPDTSLVGVRIPDHAFLRQVCRYSTVQYSHSTVQYSTAGPCSRSAAPSSATYSHQATLASTPGGSAAGGGGQYGGHYVNNTHPRYYISTKKSLIKLYVDKQASPYWEAFNVEGRRCENLLDCEVARYDEVIFTIL